MYQYNSQVCLMYSAYALCMILFLFYEDIRLQPTILYDRDGCNSSDTLYARQNLRYEVEQLLEEAILEASFDQDWYNTINFLYVHRGNIHAILHVCSYIEWT